MIKVLFINDIGKWGGAEKILYQILKSISKNQDKFQIYLITGSDGLLVNKVKKLSSISIYIESIPKDNRDLIGLFRWGLNIFKIARKLKPDLIYINNLRGIIFSSVPLKLLHKPIIWHEHNIQPTFIRKTILNLMALWLPNRIIAVSKAVANSYWAINRNNKIQVVHNGLDLSEFQNKISSDIRGEFRIPKEYSIITIASVLRPWKGHEYFIKAASFVKKEFLKTKFIILGDEVVNNEKGYKEQLINLSNSLNLEKDIIFTGFRKDVSNILLQSDIIVLSSILPDPFPTVILEAMAVAKPVVATNIGGVPEMVIDNVTGLLVPPKDSESMAKAVLKLLIDKKYSNQLGMTGSTRLNKIFTLDKFIKKIEKILLDLEYNKEY